MEGHCFTTNDIIPSLQDNIISKRNIDGDLIILSLDQDDQFYKLNGVSSEIWESIDDEKSWAQILAPVLSIYEVTEKQLNEDMSQFVEDLKKYSLLQ